MTRPLLVAAVLVVAGVGFAGAAQQRQPILNRLPPAEPADPNRPPPTRPCPDPPCYRPSAARTPMAFLNWVGADLNRFWRTNVGRVPTARWSRARQLVVAPGGRYRSTCHPNGVTSRTALSYCATDRPPTVLLPLDTVRLRILRQRHWRQWRQRGDFAMAYVVAHEWSHHVQNLLGLLRDREVRGKRIELQADCLAGFWAHSMWAQELLDETDIREAILSARLNGDAPGFPGNNPRAHGTPDERERWFKRGYVNGDASHCIVD